VYREPRLDQKGTYVIHTGQSALLRLRQLGLDVPSIHDMLMFGHAERATYTAYDARGAGEHARWSRHVRRASEIYTQQGWQRIDPDNQPTLVHQGNQWSLVVASGSSDTGRPFGNPTTKNPKGRSIRDAVQGNAEIALIKVQEVEPVLGGLRETWMLLTYVDIEDLIWFEVSLPDEMKGEFITNWKDRLLFPPFDPSAGMGASKDEREEPPSYDFTVTRK
jgi:hypothetical protein